MDLRSLCSKLDVDAIRAKIPPLPQIKLPKSMSKLKSRKIFRSSREDVNSESRRVSSKRKAIDSENLPLGPPYSIPASEFIDRTPNHISTISSLMNQREVSAKWKSKRSDDESFYHSAGGIEDYYPSPLNQRFEQRRSRPISPVRAPPIVEEFRSQSEQNIKMSFGEKFQKGYKDVTEFKLKHLFAKKTVVRNDKIEINEYIHRFDEDRLREERKQQKLDRAIADNYRFQFKVSQQKSEESYVESPASTPRNTELKRKNHKTVSELSGDESGMESSPPPRKPGIASTRFSRVRRTPLNMSLEEDNDDDGGLHVADEESVTKPKPSTLISLRQTSQKSKNVIATSKLAASRHSSVNSSMEEDQENDENVGDIDDIELDVFDENSPKVKQNPSSVCGIKKQQIPAKSSPRRMKSIKERISRRTSLKSSIEEDHDNDENADDIELDVFDANSPKVKPNTSSLYSAQKQQTVEKSSPRRMKSIKERISRITKQKPEGDEKKRKAPLTPQQSEENEADASAAAKPEKPFEAIKQNFKRLQKSIKLPQSAAESENEEANPESKTVLSKTQQFTERIKRFRSTDHIDKDPEDDENKESPMHRIAIKLQEWKNRIKKNVDLQNNDNEDDYASSPQRPVGSLMKKLKNIRARKRDSTDDPDDDEEGGETYKESLSARAKLQLEKGVVAASQVPQMTMKKISETKKYFKKKPDSDEKNNAGKSKSGEEEVEIEEIEEDEEVEEEVRPTKTVAKPVTKPVLRPPPPIPRPRYDNSSEEEDSEDRKKFIAKSIAESQIIAVPAARAVWTTKPILSDDTTDYEDDLPRVLLHQDNSDVFESTLIIAVTRPISRTTTPIITELPLDSAEESTPDTKPDNWVPDKNKASNFVTPPTQRKLSKDSNSTSNSRGHSRKESIDSSSEDSWIKDIPRGPSIAVLNSVYENEEPWKIKKRNPEDNLYKTKSIDLFEMQKKHGGVLTAFEDFDDELKNTPVVKIENEKQHTNEVLEKADNCERESSEELENPDDDNSSRVTKISVHPQEIKQNDIVHKEPELKSQPYGNSRESLTGNLDNKDVIDSGEEDDNEESDEDDTKFHEQNDNENDRPPSKTPSPPPLPPLPERQPSIRLSKLRQSSIDLACPTEPPPPLPLTKPPIPPNRPIPPPPPPKIPDRNPPTIRVSKPLVKTSSLRLAYSEQVNPQDVGKVNKLISRFEPEGPKQKPRIIPRKPWVNNESEEYSDEEDSFELLPTKHIKDKMRDTTPTNHPAVQKSFSIDSVDLPNNNEKLNSPNRETQTLLPCKATSQIILDNTESAKPPIPSISISTSTLDVNSNFSQPSSVYGSPLAYPSSLVGSTEVTPLTNRKESEYLSTRRNRRSMARDDERFYSFDSDEENSYYSISSTSSNRYIVEL